jgi:Uma2 family endonuclease
MTVVTVMPGERDWMTHGRDWTVADLEHLPDDGFRYELFDGVLVVRPAPTPRHQDAVLELGAQLRQGCPPDLKVFVAPLEFQPTEQRSFEPDLLVVHRDRIGEKKITQPPVLVIEVLSPSTRGVDQVLKRAMYQSSGVDSYWIYDPDRRELIAYRLENGEYREVARAAGGQGVTLEAPFRVTLRPDRLTDL